MRITEYLLADHERLSALLMQAVTDPGRFDAEAFEHFRAGILRHIAIEEKLLFAEARKRRQGEPLPLARRLRMDHAAITSLVVPTPDAAIVAELQSILGGHDELEEGADGVYAQCEALLGGDSEALGKKAIEYPAVPLMPHFDGTDARPVYRTAQAALAVAEKMSPPKRVKV